jgi:hypothetical protein
VSRKRQRVKKSERKSLCRVHRLLRSLIEAKAGAPVLRELPPGWRAMTDGGERSARNDRQRAPRVRGSAGPPPFINRRGLVALPRAAHGPSWIPVTRVRPLGGALQLPLPQLPLPHGAAPLPPSFGGRPFAPRVSIDRAFLPGLVRLTLGCDFEARLARATQVSFSLSTPKRHAHSFNVGGGFPGVAFALLYTSCGARSQRGDWMSTPAIKSLEHVSLEEALAYLDASEGDELGAAFALATHRNELGGSSEAPDDAEVHHALFLLRKARGLDAPSFDLMRIQLKRRVAA